MFKMAKMSLFGLLYLVLSNLQIVFSDQTCQLVDKPRLQVIFVAAYSLKRDVANSLNPEAAYGWIRYQNETMSHIMDGLSQDFPETEYSVAGFVDYDDQTNPHERNITDSELCYFVTRSFTQDKNLTLAALENGMGSSTNYGNNEEDSVTTAMLMAAVDINLKWNIGYYDASGRTVRKIMIPMVFRKITKVLGNPGSRTTPKADGMDTCTSSLPPKMSQLNKVLFDNNIAVFNSIMNSPYKGEWLSDYNQKEFGSLLVPYHQFPMPEARKEATINMNFNFETYAKSIVKKIKEEVMTCDWEEPKGYNSLGL